MLTIDKPNATTRPALPDTQRQPPKLLDRMVEAIRVRHYSLATERNYVQWARRFILFHGKRHPQDMGAAEMHGCKSMFLSGRDRYVFPEFARRLITKLQEKGK